MKIAIDFSPLSSGHYLQHRVRGTGFYLRNLKEVLLRDFSDNEYLFFKRGEKVPKDFDIVHFPYFEPFFITLPFLKSSKNIVTVHDLTPLVFPDKFPSGFKGQFKWEIQKRSLRNSAGIITDSISSKKDIVKFVGISEQKIHVVYLAAADYFKVEKSTSKLQIVKTKFNLPDNFILYVGDVTWNKNLPNLIKAINKTDHYLVIVGKAFKNDDYDKNNPWNQDLKKAQGLARNNKKIISLGFVNDDELVSLYNIADLFIMPSFYEGFGLPILEAMQSGCPVITTKNGSLSEVAGEAAYFVDPESVESIHDGIEKIMKDVKLRGEMSVKGLEQAKKFNWHKTASETTNVYRKIVKN